LPWARNPFRGNFIHWKVSRKEAGRIFFKQFKLLAIKYPQVVFDFTLPS
jgi:hypothetical protein